MPKKEFIKKMQRNEIFITKNLQKKGLQKKCLKKNYEKKILKGNFIKNKNDYGRISSGHIIPFGDSQDIISFHFI